MKDFGSWVKSVEDRLSALDRRNRGSEPFAVYHMRGAGEITPSGSWYNLIYWVPITTTPEITWSGTSDFTLRKAGVYSITFHAMFRNEVSSSGVRAVAIQNASLGGQISGTYTAPIAAQGDYVTGITVGEYRLAANTVIQLRTLQNSGGAVTIHGSPWTSVAIRRVGG